jgi:CBS domain-containing protein
MKSPIAVCQVNDTLAVAARRLWNHHCTTLPVVREDGKLVGVIGDRDICMAALSQQRPLDEVLVNVAMSTDVASVHPEQDVEIAEELMAERQVWRLPVVDDAERPLGMISLADLASESARSDSLIDDGFLRVGRVATAICRHHERHA